jgi:hypothetical protein
LPSQADSTLSDQDAISLTEAEVSVVIVDNEGQNRAKRFRKVKRNIKKLESSLLGNQKSCLKLKQDLRYRLLSVGRSTQMDVEHALLAELDLELNDARAMNARRALLLLPLLVICLLFAQALTIEPTS